MYYNFSSSKGFLWNQWQSLEFHLRYIKYCIQYCKKSISVSPTCLITLWLDIHILQHKILPANTFSNLSQISYHFSHKDIMKSPTHLHHLVGFGKEVPVTELPTPQDLLRYVLNIREISEFDKRNCEQICLYLTPWKVSWDSGQQSVLDFQKLWEMFMGKSEDTLGTGYQKYFW